MFSKVEYALFGYTAGMLVTHWMATRKLNMMKERLEEEEERSVKAEERAVKVEKRAVKVAIDLFESEKMNEMLREQCSRDDSDIKTLREERETLASELRVFKAQRAIKEQQRDLGVVRQKLAEAAANALLGHPASKSFLGD